MTLSVNFSDRKSAFKNWISQNRCTHPGVAKEEGGVDFKNALKNGNVGGPKYLIKPDKSVIKRPSSSQINDAGGNVQHNCQTALDHELNKNLPTLISIFKVTKNNFAIKVSENDLYAISFYTANGKQETSLQRKLSKGLHTIDFPNVLLAGGLYIVEIKYGKNSMQTRVLVK